MISEGSCDWCNDAKMSALMDPNKLFHASESQVNVCSHILVTLPSQ